MEFTVSSDSETQIPNIILTKLRTDDNYVIFYKSGLKGIGLMLLPFLAILYFSVKIVYALGQRHEGTRRHTATLRKRLSQRRTSNSSRNVSDLSHNTLQISNEYVAPGFEMENIRHLATRRKSYPPPKLKRKEEEKNLVTRGKQFHNLLLVPNAVEGGHASAPPKRNRIRPTWEVNRSDMNLATVVLFLAAVFLISNSGKCCVQIWEITHIGKIQECIKMEKNYKVNKKT